jgi:hypothetical protein
MMPPSAPASQAMHSLPLDNDDAHVVQELYLNDDHGTQDFATLHLVEGVFDLI